MRFALAALLLVTPAASFAQDDEDSIDTTVSAPGVQLNMKLQAKGGGKQPQPAPRGPPAGGAVGDVALECAPANGIAPSVIKVTGLEGALAQVYADDGELEGRYTVPFNFKGRGDTYYRFVIQAADGSLLLDRKLETKMYVGCAARLGGSAGRPAPAPAPAADSARGMPAGDFQALLDAVNDEGFSDGKLRVVATAAQGAMFSVSQVGQLIDAMSFSADKLKTLELVRAKIVDRQNAFRLLERFSFSGDKAKAQALLR